MSFRRILVAVDGSPIGAHAGAIGMELAQDLGGQVAMVSVVDPNLAEAVASDRSPDVLLEEARSGARRAIEAVGSRPELEFLVEGEPAEEIVRTATEWPADLIVVGSHGRGGFDRMLLGSVAEAVMRHAPCPVLVVRAMR